MENLAQKNSAAYARCMQREDPQEEKGAVVYTTKRRVSNKFSPVDTLRFFVFPKLNVQVLDVEGVILYEAPARLDGVAHQHCENLVGFHRVVDFHL